MYILFVLQKFCLSSDLLQKNNCITPEPENKPGNCVYLTKCDNLIRKILSKSLTETDKEFLRKSLCGFKNEQPIVCCDPKYIQQDFIPAILKRTHTLFPEPGICGVQSSFKIYGGTDADILEFPWTALIKYENNVKQISFHCGGALINARYILTAAHCVTGHIVNVWTPKYIRLGEWNLQTTVDCIVVDDDYYCADPHIDVPIEEIIIHENYVAASRNQYHDIALVRMKEAVIYTEFVRPLCLPITNHLRKIDFTKKNFIVAGWGKTKSASSSDIKQKVFVPGYDTQLCSAKYKGERIFITSSQLCAGGVKGKDSCVGDSGDALITADSINNQPYWYLAGLVSFGTSPCGLEGWPAVYTKVNEYIEWIQANVRN